MRAKGDHRMICKYAGKDKCPLAQAGGKARVRKGFAVKPATADARAKAWRTRKAGQRQAEGTDE